MNFLEMLKFIRAVADQPKAAARVHLACHDLSLGDSEMTYCAR
jgi:hypothetical protein